MLKITLDTNCMILYFEQGDEFVARLIRYALERKVDLAITTRAYADLERNKLDERKESMLKKVGSFPVLPTGARWGVSNWDSGDFWVGKDYEALVRGVQEILFPSLDTSDLRFKNKICDVDHLAGHIWARRDFFVTYDEGFLRRKKQIEERWGVKIVSPQKSIEQIRKVEAEDLKKRRNLLQNWRWPSVYIRCYEDGDRNKVEKLIPKLKTHYPHIEDWLPRKMDNISAGEDTCVVAVVDNEIAGVSVSSEKEPGVVKLSTFYINDEYRGMAVGPHLLYHEVQRWANQHVRKVYVTFPAEEAKNLMPFFRQYGFLVEGLSPLRYCEDSLEVIMGKMFCYKSIDRSGFMEFVRKHLFELRGFCVKELDESTLTARPEFGFLGEKRPKGEGYYVKFSLDEVLHEGQIKGVAEKARSQGLIPFFISFYGFPPTTPLDKGILLDAYDIETIFYPIELKKPEQKGIICSIKPQWAEALLSYTKEPVLFSLSPVKLRLRTDNVYYRKADRFKNLRRGSPVLFYVSSPISGIVGEAKIVSYSVDTPKRLFEKHGELGIYNLKNIVQVAGRRGVALAIKFDWHIEYPRILALDEIREVISSFNPIAAREISYEQFLELRRRVGKCRS